MNWPGLSPRRLLTADPGADRIVPPSGFTVWLTLFTAAAMAFLTVFALALSLASGRLASSWGAELARAAVVRQVALRRPRERRRRRIKKTPSRIRE